MVSDKRILKMDISDISLENSSFKAMHHMIELNNAALILMKKVTPFHERFVIFYVNCLLKSRGKEAGRKEGTKKYI